MPNYANGTNCHNVLNRDYEKSRTVDLSSDVLHTKEKKAI